MNLGTYDINIDFSKLFIHNNTSIYFKEGDLNTAKVRARLTMKNKPINIAGCNVTIRIEPTEGNTITDNATVIDPINGIIEIDFKSNALLEGTHLFEVWIIKDESIKKSGKIGYRVLDSIEDAGSIEGTNEYPILISLISDTNKAIQDAKEVLNIAKDMESNVNEAIGNTNVAISNAETATSNANSKITELDDAKTSMVEKVDSSIATMKADVNKAKEDMKSTTDAKVKEIDTAITNMNSSVEDAKSDMQATTDAKMQQVDNSIVAMKSDVETAKNEMVSKADEKIADIDRALAAGTVDLELKASRDGEESLPARLKRDLYIDEVPVKQRVLNLENMKEMQDLEYSSDKGYAICEKTGNGTVKDLKIYGRSLLNISKSKSLRCVSLGNGLVESKTVFDYDLNNGDEYTICFDVLPESTAKSVIIAFYDKNGNGKGAFFRGDLNTLKGKRVTLKTNILYNDLPAKTLRMYTLGECLEGEMASIDNIVLLKGDLTQNPPNSYWEGIASVGYGNPIEISSLKWNGNLFDDNVLKPYITSENDLEYMIDYGRIWMDKAKLVNLPFKPNTSYKLICTQKATGTNAKPRFYFHYTDGTEDQVTIANENWETVFGISKPNKTLEYISATYGSSGGTWTLKKNSICLYEDTSKTEYEPFEQDKKTILFKDSDNTWKPILNLMGINEYKCDSVEDGKYSKWIKSVVFSDVTGWTLSDDTKTKTIRFSRLINDCEVINDNPSVLCDKLPSKFNYSTDEEGIFIARKESGKNGSIYLRINKDKLKTPDLNGFGEWIKTNNMTLNYKAEFVETYEINPIYPEAFEDETLMLFKTGPISPRATWKITSNLPNFVKELSKQVRQLQDQVYKTNVANFTVALNALDTKLRLDRLEAPKQ